MTTGLKVGVMHRSSVPMNNSRAHFEPIIGLIAGNFQDALGCFRYADHDEIWQIK